MRLIPEGLRRPFRFRNYRLYFTGFVVSMLGLWMYGVASSWLVYRLTDSSLMLGTVAFCGQIPLLVLAPFGGTIADAFDRRKIIFCTQLCIMAAALTLAGLTLTGVINVWEIMALSAFIGCVAAVDGPTRQAFVVEMVGRDELPNAIALNSSVSNAMRLVGPMLAGALIPLVGEGGVFLCYGLGFAALLVCLLFIKVPPRVIESGRGNPLARVAEGVRFAWGHLGLRVVLLALGCISMLCMPVNVLMPVFASQVLDGSAGTLGLLLSASAAGGLAGALALASRTRKTGILLWVMGASLCGGLGMAAFSRAGSLPFALGLLAVAGGGQVVIIAALNTLLQVSTPDEYLGRVLSLFTMMVIGMGPIGSLSAGAMAEWWGAPATFLICGLGLTMVMIVAIPLLIRHMRGVA